MTYPTLYERLVANTKLLDPDDPNSCWLWTGSVNRENGYPRLSIRVPGRKNPKTIYAHRAMLEEVHDIWFPFDEAGHLCYQPLCINPAHLEVQTKAFNMMERRGCGHFNYTGCMIPTIFPRHEHIEHRLEQYFTGADGGGDAGGCTCPF